MIMMITILIIIITTTNAYSQIGIKSICPSLLQLRMLQHLDLSKNSLGRKGILNLAQVPLPSPTPSCIRLRSMFIERVRWFVTWVWFIDLRRFDLACFCDFLLNMLSF